MFRFSSPLSCCYRGSFSSPSVIHHPVAVYRRDDYLLFDCKAHTVIRVRVRRSVIRVRIDETAIRIRIVVRTADTAPSEKSTFILFRGSVWVLLHPHPDLHALRSTPAGQSRSRLPAPRRRQGAHRHSCTSTKKRNSRPHRRDRHSHSHC